MRTATVIVVVSALLCLIAAFLPVGQLDVGGRLLATKTSRSLWQLGHSSDGVRAFLHSYQKSTAKKIGAKVLDKVASKLPGRARSAASDVQDALATLDSLKDEDVKTVGTIVSAVLWSLLVLSLVLAILAYGMTPSSHVLRLVAMVLGSLVLAALTLAIYLVLDRVVLEANAEVERELFTLRYGAALLPAGGVGALLGSLASIVAFIRGRRRAAAATATPATA